MKNIFIKSMLTGFITVFSFNACDVTRLDSPPLGLTEESYFTLQSEFEQALYNAYAKMTDWYWYRAQSFLQRCMISLGMTSPRRTGYMEPGRFSTTSIQLKEGSVTSDGQLTSLFSAQML